MGKNRFALKFDHREIVVVFSLFIFVSLLMFTVGIVVGKGLTLAKYEGRILSSTGPSSVLAEADKILSEGLPPNASGSHITTPSSGNALEGQKALAKAAPADVAQKKPLKLVPKEGSRQGVYDGSLKEPPVGYTKKSNKLLKDPKISKLLESDGKRKRKAKRSLASKSPISYPAGKYTVQIGSYPVKQQAENRVANLKKMGFQHAYFSAKQLSGRSGTWYRVWLGYYPNQRSAEVNAKYLQKRGEVKNYLVRKTSDSTG
jgi:hypothetical protein